MSRHRSVSETLELVATLRGVVSDCAEREQRLEHDFRLRTQAETRRFEAAQEAEQSRLTAELEQAEAGFCATEQQLEAAYIGRKTRIHKAHHNAQKKALERIELEEGNQKYAAQKGLLDTERNRKADLAANDTRAEAFRALLAEQRQAFMVLEEGALRAFGGYGVFRRWLSEPPASPAADLARDEHQLLEAVRQLREKTAGELARFRRLPAPAIFRFLPLGLLLGLLVGVHVGLVPALRYFKVDTVAYPHVAGSLVVWVALVLGGYLAGRRRAAPLATSVAGNLELARRLHNAALEKCAARHQQEAGRIETEARDRTQQLNAQWDAAVAEAAERRDAWPKLMDRKAAMVVARHEVFGRRKLERLEQARADTAARLRRESAARLQPMTTAHATRMAQFQADHDARWHALEAEWKTRLQPVFEAMEAATAAARGAFPEWRPELRKDWTPPARFGNAVPFACLEVDVPKLAGACPKDPRLVLPGPARLSLPLLLTYPAQGSLLIETAKADSEAVAGMLNNIILRLLSQAPPGKLGFTIIDPVKLGQSFAGVMHLADYEESLVNRRIWTQAAEIDQRLADLNEHMEKVIQMYLRNEYATIAEYNEQAGNIAEKYHFLVIADFPVNFSETAIRRLVNIAASGARCGVYMLIHWDRRQAMPPEFVLEELRKSSVCISCPGQAWLLTGKFLEGTRLIPDPPPAPELATDFLHRVGVTGKDANRVEVPFAHVSPEESQLWSLDTTEELSIPIGRSGATKLQYLAIGKGTRQHALVAGKTGSGKSTLFHVLITNLALWCSPDQVEFYLVDFKKGVEFKCYATHRLPHARAVAIESDREFGLSVLQRVDEELRRRGDIFRQLGVQDLAGYKRTGRPEPMPRCLLLIDEFQEFFVEDDRVSQGAAVLLDRIVRQGRAFGIHVLLGSQTLGGAYTLARTTIGQMVIRIALQCNEADAYLIMDDNNPAPRLLSRPGEGIYNDMAGLTEGNSPFQTVWLPDEEREACLERIRAVAGRRGVSQPAPFVFEGNAPAEVRDNALLRGLLEASPRSAPAAARLWLGAPNSIKGPTEAVLQRQSGNHLLVVGQRDEAALAILSVALVSLAAQYPPGAARLVLLDSTPPGSPPREFVERLSRALPRDFAVARGGELAQVLGDLASELKRRADSGHEAEAPPCFLFLYGLQNFKKLRQEEEFSFGVGDAGAAASPAALLGDLIVGGATHGIHVLATCDTYNNVTRYLGRKALSEFEMRVLFQMSANDSASLIDNPKANTLGLHRALFYNEQEGYLETFRPYALPDTAWLDEVSGLLTRRFA